MIPSGWEVKKLEDIANIERGKFSVRPRNDPRYYGGNMPFVQTGDISSSVIYLEKYSQTLNNLGVKVSKVFPKNTILMTIAANIGDTAITQFDVACPDSLVAIQAKKGIDIYWLNQFLQTKKEKLDRLSTQNAQKNINLQVLKPLEVLLPPLAEQKKIADILSTWDKAIDTCEKLLQNSEQQKKALMQQLLTGKKRLKNENGERFSREWESIELKKLCSIKTGKKDVNEGNPNGIYPFFTCASKPTMSDNYSYDCEALLIAGNGVIGETHYFKGKFEAYQRTYILNMFSDKLDIFYLYQYIRYFLNRDITREKQHGAMPYIKLNLLEKFMVSIPILEEQKAIATVLTNADKQIENLKQQREKLQLEKKALMQRLLTGKIRVSV